MGKGFMPRQVRKLAESGVYHVMLRGVNRSAVFLEDEDYRYFLGALRRTSVRSGCVILAYCLMPNHVHLVVRTTDEQIGAVIKRLGVRYVGWFNRKYLRVGHLFQDRFRSEPVETDAYLATLLRYVWNNPVAGGLAVRAEDYPWSSRGELGSSGHLVDVESLERLFQPGQLAEIVAPGDIGPGSRRPIGRPHRVADELAASLLVRACGATRPEDFSLLAPAVKVRVIRELHSRSVSYRQLARLTGLSSSQVQRLHVAGSPGSEVA